jgi:Fe-S-cluster containining protein
MTDPMQEVLASAYGLRLAERETAGEILAKKKSRARLIELVDDAVGFAEITIGEHSTFDAACEAGCVWCCYQRVSASPAEVLRIVDYLRQNHSPEELASLHARVVELDQQTRGLSAEERLSIGQPCPLLVDGRCSVYYVRPLTCRGYTSNDAFLCQRKTEEPDQTFHIEADPIRYFYCQGVLNGIYDGLTAHGLDGNMVELIAALRIALEDAASLKRWLKGERLFVEAQVEVLPTS